ncbi:response regulator [Ketobacter sp.]|uniref:response regulator n=1 Tax=Ketobacter sp. TaxID=2083498 RepID=UPI000F1628C5|nr:response regulator [Ketobacter sp.]RLT96926.1 MAG: response regulator [Ketobacter sp.]
MERHILIVDDEPNILNALERLLEEQDDMTVYRASGGEEGLAIMDANPEIGVVLSDQRMPNMTGTEFLKQVKLKHENVVRLILSGYSELGTITQAINEGSIFKFLTKPWEDDLLLKAISEAFDYYELSNQNRLLNAELQATNHKLAELNSNLEQLVEEKTRNLQLHIASLRVYQEAMEHFPYAVIGLDDADTIVLENQAARRRFADANTSLLGLPTTLAFRGEWESLPAQLAAAATQHLHFDLNDHRFNVFQLGDSVRHVGTLLIAAPSTGATRHD